MVVSDWPSRRLLDPLSGRVEWRLLDIPCRRVQEGITAMNDQLRFCTSDTDESFQLSPSFVRTERSTRTEGQAARKPSNCRALFTGRRYTGSNLCRVERGSDAADVRRTAEILSARVEGWFARRCEFTPSLHRILKSKTRNSNDELASAPPAIGSPGAPICGCCPMRREWGLANASEFLSP